MVQEMMTKRFSAFILMILVSGFSLALPLFCENGKWVIAAQRFVPDSGLENDSVNTKTSEMLPSDILEKIGTTIVRNVVPDEQFERTKYKLRTERQSLFLQLSAEYKKRDSLVLNHTSELRLKTAISDSQKKIKSIQKKLQTCFAEVCSRLHMHIQKQSVQYATCSDAGSSLSDSVPNFPFIFKIQIISTI